MRTRFLLAPMAELSHRALRELIGSFGGCDEYFTEMISAPALLAGGEFESYYMENLPDPSRLVYQLTGADQDHLARAAALLDSRECAGIDINMGCAAPLITKTGAGVRWMYDRDRACGMMSRVRQNVKKRLSVKLRLGPDENFEYLLSFCRGLEEAGTELITLHPRTAGEKFRRRAKWQYVEALAGELGIPVAGNGDIADAAALAAKSGGPWEAVMVGRAAVRCPWIFSRARIEETASKPGGTSPRGREFRSLPLIEETGFRFLDLLSQYQPPAFHLSRARRFFHYFCDNLKWGNYVKTLLNREESLSGIASAWSAYFRTGSE